MDELGRLYQHGVGIKPDPIQAFAWYHKSAKMGNGCGMNDLGWCFEKGLGCQQNEKKAAKWYLKAAIAGNVSGENNIGFYFDSNFLKLLIYIIFFAFRMVLSKRIRNRY